MKRATDNSLRLALRLFGKSLGVIIPFELLYRSFAIYGILPLIFWLLEKSLAATGIQYVTTENIAQALLNPLTILATVVVFIVLTAYTVFEISFLTLAFQQNYQAKPLGFLRMLSASVSDALRTVRPQNYGLILLIILVIPVSNSVMLSSLLGGLQVPAYIMEVILATPLYLWGLGLLLALLFFVIFRYIFLFHVYTLEDKTVRQAAQEAVKIAKGQRLSILWKFLLWELLATLLIGAVFLLIRFALIGVTYAMAGNDTLYAVLLTVNSSVSVISDFVFSSLLVCAGYAFVSAVFFQNHPPSAVLCPREPLLTDYKKGNRRICVVICLAGIVTVCGSSYLSVQQATLPGIEQPLVTAHRGYAKDVPENTLPAFQKAMNLKADYIELDVQEARDGAIVVTHDTNFVRCAGVDKNVWELTLAQIKELDVGRYFSKDYQGTKIPTLQEVLAFCKGKIRLNIELKANGHERNLENSVAALIEEYGMEKEVVVTSLTKKCLVNFRERLPNVPCGYIVSMAVGNYISVPWSDFFCVEQSFVSKRLVRQARQHGKTITAWTIDTEPEVRSMYEMGVQGVITGDPRMARETIMTFSDPLRRLLYAILD